MDETVTGILAADPEPLIGSFLQAMYAWGIAVIRGIQSIESAPLTAVMKVITALGTEVFYVPVILVVFWCVSEKRGLRLALLIIMSAWINLVFKELLQQPRPFTIDPSLGLAVESTYGAPSGHAQMSLSFWIPTAVWLGALRPKLKPIAWTAAIFIIALIGFTRLYLGVHFPTDLVAGWLVAGIILAVFFTIIPRIEKPLANGGIRAQNISAACIALLMNGVFPQERALPAAFLGFCLGYTLMKQRFPFCARENSSIRIMLFRCIVGFFGIIAVYVTLRLILPSEASLLRDLPMMGKSSPLYDLAYFIRYGAVGFWASAGATLVFRRIGLA